MYGDLTGAKESTIRNEKMKRETNHTHDKAVLCVVCCAYECVCVCVCMCEYVCVCVCFPRTYVWVSTSSAWLNHTDTICYGYSKRSHVDVIVWQLDGLGAGAVHAFSRELQTECVNDK